VDVVRADHAVADVWSGLTTLDSHRRENLRAWGHRGSPGPLSSLLAAPQAATVRVASAVIGDGRVRAWSRFASTLPRRVRLREVTLTGIGTDWQRPQNGRCEALVRSPQRPRTKRT
jgi:hypothetical protein